MHLRPLPLLLALSLSAAGVQAAPAAAATPPAASAPRFGTAFEVHGTALDGRPFSTAQLRGKVVLVLYWRTDCAACRTRMPELRANYQGWKDKPFELVTVSLDAKRTDAADYARTVSAVLVSGRPIPSLWAGESGYADSLPARPQQLPLAVVIDAGGHVAFSAQGGIPPEAWDAIADLLP